MFAGLFLDSLFSYIGLIVYLNASIPVLMTVLYGKF